MGVGSAEVQPASAKIGIEETTHIALIWFVI